MHLPCRRTATTFKLFRGLTVRLLTLLAITSWHVSARQEPAPAKSDSQDQTVRLKADLVDLRAVVTDKQGRPVTNLTKDDFEIVENGRNQVISFFSAESLAHGSAVSIADRSDSRRPAAPKLPGGSMPAEPVRRTVVFFVDTINLSNLSLLRVKEVLLKFIDERLGEGDLAAVIATTGGLGPFSQFTGDKQVLRMAVNRLSVSPRPWSNSLYTPFLAARVQKEAPTDQTENIPGSTSTNPPLNPLLVQLPPALRTAMNIVRAEENWPDDAHTFAALKALVVSRGREILLHASYQRRVTMDTLRAIAERLANLPGQRLVFLLSDGFTMQGDSGDSDSSELQQAVSRASRYGVVVYTIAAKGLTGLSMNDASLPARFTPDAPGFNELPGFMAASDRELEDGLTRIAAATGGEAFLTTNNLRGALEKAEDNNGFYYGLAYYPARVDTRSGFRSIKIRVKGHSDYRVRTQGGYLASELTKDQPAAPVDPLRALVKAMGEPLAATGINLNVSADFLYLPADNAQISLNVFVDAGKLTYKEQDGSYQTNLILMTGLIDSGGNSMGILQDTIQIRLSGEQLERARMGAYHYSKRIILKPGLYQVRVGVRDPGSDLIGTAGAWVNVPNLGSKRLALSSVETSKVKPAENDLEAQVGTVLIRPNVRNGVNLFRSGEPIEYKVRAYNPEADGRVEELTAQVVILSGNKVVHEESWQPLSSLIAGKSPGIIEIAGQVKTDGVKPDLYQLRLQVKLPGKGTILTTETPIEIVANRE